MIQNGSNEPRESGGPTPRRLKTGEPFNPWHKLCGFYAPDIVARQRDLTDGQKRLYERAVRWAGRNGTFWYGFDTMAAALGKSVRQVKSDMAVLEARNLLRHMRRRRNSNLYSFLWHAMFEVQPTALQQDDLEVQDSLLEVQDSVALEVQPTAQEFSPLESRPLNSVEADKKLITGAASQERRTGASPSFASSEPGPKGKDPRTKKAASPNTDQNSPEGVPGSWSEGELADLRRQVVELLGREPSEGFENSLMLRARTATAADVSELVRRKLANSKCQEGGRWAPKNQNWFLTVIENEFSPGHIAEPPTSSLHHRIDPEVLNDGIDAIELPDAPRSIVESVRCSHCGGFALAQYTNGRIEGCDCRTSRRGGLARFDAGSITGFIGLPMAVDAPATA